jgi:4-azaleucine resistance transporter AzlC
MTSSTAKSVYWQGIRDGIPFILMVVPFAMLFGVVATEAGLNIIETVGFSVLVIAGAAQFAALQLMVEDAPTVVIIATALAVNLRMAMYSASLAVHLGPAPLWKRAIVAYVNFDQSYAMSSVKYDAEPEMNWQEKLAYFFGVVTLIAPLWIIMSLVGALLGKSISSGMGLDFAMPIAFIAVIAPMLKTLAHVAAAATSVCLALALVSLPLNFGLAIAGVAAMIVGACVETLMESR